MRRRSYWTYSAGLLVAWGLVFALTALLRGAAAARDTAPVFFGFLIGWVSTTIARYVYPPPGRFRPGQGGTPS